MAKVTGPLYSMSARGKIADAMVFFPWKGVNAVREWLIPVNKMSADQGNQRTMLAGVGRAVGKIYPNPGHTTVGAFAQQLIDLGLITGNQTKQSYLVKYILDHYLDTTANYSTYLTAWFQHTNKGAFSDCATALGISDFSLAYDSIATFDKAFGLYLIAKFATTIPLTGTPYSLALASWTTASVSSMICDFTKA